MEPIQHFLYFAWDPWNWITNVTASVVVGAIVVMLWPYLRHKVEAWVKRQHAAASAELHRKLDHIIAHHPDIPPLEESPDE